MTLLLFWNTSVFVVMVTQIIACRFQDHNGPYSNEGIQLHNNQELMDKYSMNKRDNIASILSQMPESELIKLLIRHPEKTDVRFNSGNTDMTLYETQNQGKGIVNKRFEKVYDHNSQGDGYFRLTDNELTLKKIIKPSIQSSYGKSEEENNNDADSAEEKRREAMFDLLVAQLKKLCFNKIKPTIRKKKKLVFNMDANANIPTEIYNNAKNNLELRRPSIIERPELKNIVNDLGKEQIFLILNDELRANSSDDLISVDPDSLDPNSSVLLLGPIKTRLTDQQLQIVMSRITDEISKPEYSPLLRQISDGKLSSAYAGLVKNIISGPQTRRYIKPHRCNHQSKVAKVHGGPQWLICSGYLNINGPSLYD